MNSSLVWHLHSLQIRSTTEKGIVCREKWDLHKLEIDLLLLKPSRMYLNLLHSFQTFPNAFT